jgi:predicted amino acid dehydrogenase
LLCCAAALCCLQEVNDIRAGMEKAKNDIIKSTIAIMGTFSAIAFTITRLMATM